LTKALTLTSVDVVGGARNETTAISAAASETATATHKGVERNFARNVEHRGS